MPEGATETATLTLTGLATNPVAVQIAPRDTSSSPAWNARSAPASASGTALIDKPPPLAVSVYEPVYFIVGGDGGLNAKFQISLRFRLFDDRGRLARQLPWIDDLYLSFSQTSLWDLGELSKPFKDSSYRPRLFYANYDLARYLDGKLRVGVETGIGHESNGKEGDDSRSYNMLYARPTLTFGDPDGLRAYFAPLIHNYIAESDNPDIEDYRGYVDWLFGVGSKGGLDFWAVLRKGTRSDYRQHRAQCVVSAVQAERRRSDRLAAAAVLQRLRREPARLQPQARIAVAARDRHRVVTHATGATRLASIEILDCAACALDLTALRVCVPAAAASMRASVSSRDGPSARSALARPYRTGVPARRACCVLACESVAR